MPTLATIYAWFLATADNGDHSVSLITVLIVLAIIALIVFIVRGGWWRGG